MVEGCLWIAYTGAPWRDLPERFGPWETVYYRFNRWRKDGTWMRVLAALLDRTGQTHGVDLSLFCVDASVVRAHKAAAGAGKKISPDQPGRARGPRVGPFARRLGHQGPPAVRRPRATARRGTDARPAA